MFYLGMCPTIGLGYGVYVRVGGISFRARVSFTVLGSNLNTFFSAWKCSRPNLGLKPARKKICIALRSQNSKLCVQSGHITCVVGGVTLEGLKTPKIRMPALLGSGEDCVLGCR